MSTLWSLLVLTRAHFLMGGVIMYAMGAAIARADGASLDLPRLLWGQIGVSAIQLMTHFVNEYYDADRDALVVTRTLFSGGSGVLPGGRLGRQMAVWGAGCCALVGVSVTLTVGWPALSIYAGALLVGYGYSAPPLRLMTRGLGELFAATTVALLTPLAGYSVAAGRLSASVIWPGLPLLATSLAFMIVVALPDYESDKPTNKRNWVVRLGRDRAGHVHNGLLALSYVLLILVATADRLPAQVATLLWLTLPLAVWQMGGVWLRVYQGWLRPEAQPEGRHFGLLAGGAMVLIGGYGLLAGLGYWFCC
jgi:1,4-dihydroxy-2-naphthoate octaprenyltransferase